MSDLAIYYEPSAFSFKDRTMGRQAAGTAFLRAVANTKPEKLWCYSNTRTEAQECASVIAEFGSSRTGIIWVPRDRPDALRDPGLLFRPDPAISQQAWHRLAHSEARRFSICGITHTISSHAPMSAFADYLTAPLESWDAVICTSRAARDAARHVVEAQAEHLAARLNATRFTLPQMPVIPLGVHVQQFSKTPEVREASRQRLNLADDEVAVLFAGRLIIHGKAHPLAMYLALEQAAKGRKVVLLQAGQAPSPEMRKVFIDEPKRFCPSVRVVMIDGANSDLYKAAWSAADIFTSLSDNFQETFGLTPIEAMAASLPVVVSDWDGYKDTVRDGIDGFRVPTLTLQPGSGADLANRYDLGLINFDYYSAYTSQLVAIDIQATAEAYRQLIEDPDLRKRMGAAGAQRAREVYDWAVVYRRYLDLWEELRERRRCDPQLAPVLPRRQRPDRADPFSMFASYPTHHIGPTVSFRRAVGIDLEEAVSRRELASTSFAKATLPPPKLIERIFKIIDKDWTAFVNIMEELADVHGSITTSSLVWLCKVGALDFRHES